MIHLGVKSKKEQIRQHCLLRSPRYFYLREPSAPDKFTCLYSSIWSNCKPYQLNNFTSCALLLHLTMRHFLFECNKQKASCRVWRWAPTQNITYPQLHLFSRPAELYQHFVAFHANQHRQCLVSMASRWCQIGLGDLFFKIILIDPHWLHLLIFHFPNDNLLVPIILLKDLTPSIFFNLTVAILQSFGITPMS